MKVFKEECDIKIFKKLFNLANAPYCYPIDNFDYFSSLLGIISDDHTMGISLKKYLEIKIPSTLSNLNYNRVVVRGNFERSKGLSSKEKRDKLFNYMRPSAYIQKDIAYVNCYPGIDYVFHYGNIIKSYFKLKNISIKVEHRLPTDVECWRAIIESELQNVPIVHTVIMGYVEGLQFISGDNKWNGSGNFLWKRTKTKSGDAILLGCKHTYWGEIAGRIVAFLLQSGVKRIIYSGKLGTLNSVLEPNKVIATGNNSTLPNGKKIIWENIFDKINDNQVIHGNHITVPSVLQETKIWLSKSKNDFDFVDPEIGHMANAASINKGEFSYFHIVSDNLSAKYDYDLSNERKIEVLNNRKILFRKIGNAIINS